MIPWSCCFLWFLKILVFICILLEPPPVPCLYHRYFLLLFVLLETFVFVFPSSDVDKNIIPHSLPLFVITFIWAEPIGLLSSGFYGTSSHRWTIHSSQLSFSQQRLLPWYTSLPTSLPPFMSPLFLSTHSPSTCSFSSPYLLPRPSPSLLFPVGCLWWILFSFLVYYVFILLICLSSPLLYALFIPRPSCYHHPVAGFSFSYLVWWALYASAT